MRTRLYSRPQDARDVFPVRVLCLPVVSLDDTWLGKVSQTNERQDRVQFENRMGLWSLAGVRFGAAPEQRLSWHGNADPPPASSSGKVFPS